MIDYPKKVLNSFRERYQQHSFLEIEVKKIDHRGIALILLRIELVRNILSLTDNPVTWIDTDVIIRGDISYLLEIDRKQLKIFFRGEDRPEKVRVNAGVFSLGNSDITLDFVLDWYKGLLSNPVWGQGQLFMYRSYKKYEKDIEMVKLSKSFNDLGDTDNPDCFLDDSVIWHCKKGHFYNPKFQKEFQYYLREIG